MRDLDPMIPSELDHNSGPGGYTRDIFAKRAPPADDAPGSNGVSTDAGPAAGTSVADEPAPSKGNGNGAEHNPQASPSDGNTTNDPPTSTGSNKPTTNGPSSTEAPADTAPPTTTEDAQKGNEAGAGSPDASRTATDDTQTPAPTAAASAEQSDGQASAPGEGSSAALPTASEPTSSTGENTTNEPSALSTMSDQPAATATISDANSNAPSGSSMTPFPPPAPSSSAMESGSASGSYVGNSSGVPDQAETSTVSQQSSAVAASATPSIQQGSSAHSTAETASPTEQTTPLPTTTTPDPTHTTRSKEDDATLGVQKATTTRSFSVTSSTATPSLVLGQQECDNDPIAIGGSCPGDYFCNAATRACVKLKALGDQCYEDFQCDSAYCGGSGTCVDAPQHQGEQTLSGGQIGGAVVGSVVGALLLVCLLIVFRRRKQAAQRRAARARHFEDLMQSEMTLTDGPNEARTARMSKYNFLAQMMGGTSAQQQQQQQQQQPPEMIQQQQYHRPSPSPSPSQPQQQVIYNNYGDNAMMQQDDQHYYATMAAPGGDVASPIPPNNNSTAIYATPEAAAYDQQPPFPSTHKPDARMSYLPQLNPGPVAPQQAPVANSNPFRHTAQGQEGLASYPLEQQPSTYYHHTQHQHYQNPSDRRYQFF